MNLAVGITTDLRKDLEVRRWVAAAFLIAALAIGGIAGAIVTAMKDGSSSPENASPVFVTAANEEVAGELSFDKGFASAVQAALPSVVNISASKVVHEPGGGSLSPFFDDPFFRRFFGRGFSDQFDAPRERREQGLGSGVIVSPEGYILTNNHVVEGASEIKINLSDKREFKAGIVGADPKTDIAVLKVEKKNLPVMTIGHSSNVRVGEFALAIGNPFGVGQTVTMGIISASGRGIGLLGAEGYEDFIQTDAAINPGNSGGALINARGELIGINTAIVSRGAPGNQGVGFAVPIDMARQVMEQIIKSGKVVRGWLGVLVQEVTPALAQAFKLDEARGALVSDVTPDGPAAKAGLAKGDIITEINGQRVADSRSLRLQIAGTAPGTSVRLKLLREGGEREVSVTLGELPASQQQVGRSDSDTNSTLEGVTVDDLTPQIARQLNLPANTRGVVVTEVKSGSPAADAGLRRGDVIMEVNRKPVTSVGDFRRTIGQTGGDAMLLLINRGGNTLFIAIESGK